MYQLPDLAQAICADKLRAAERGRLRAQAYAARRKGTRRGIGRLAGLSLRLPLTPGASRRAARAC